eukprot:138103-Rhodomonas_salina.1
MQYTRPRVQMRYCSSAIRCGIAYGIAYGIGYGAALVRVEGHGVRVGMVTAERTEQPAHALPP